MLPFLTFLKPVVCITSLVGLPDCWAIQTPLVVPPNRAAQRFHLIRGLITLAIVLGVVGHVYWGLSAHANDPGQELGMVVLFIDGAIWCMSVYPAVVTHLLFAFKSPSIRTLFTIWDRLYLSHRLSCSERSVRYLGLMFTLYAIMGIASIGSVVSYVVSSPSPGLLTYEPLFASGFLGAVAIFLHTLHITYSWVFVILGELGIGILCYYLSLSFAHINKTLDSAYRVLPLLQMDPAAHSGWTATHLSNIGIFLPESGVVSSPEANFARKRYKTTIPVAGDRTEQIQDAWLATESIIRLIDQFSSTFSMIILAVQGGHFLMTCVLGYAAIRRKSVARSMYISYLVNFIFYLVRMICFNGLCSSISNQYEKLQLTITGLTSLYSADRVLHLFMNRLHGRSVCMNPYGLYTMTNSTLLAMFSAILTYMIVLLQSSDS